MGLREQCAVKVVLRPQPVPRAAPRAASPAWVLRPDPARECSTARARARPPAVAPGHRSGRRARARRQVSDRSEASSLQTRYTLLRLGRELPLLRAAEGLADDSGVRGLEGTKPGTGPHGRGSRRDHAKRPPTSGARAGHLRWSGQVAIAYGEACEALIADEALTTKSAGTGMQIHALMDARTKGRTNHARLCALALSAGIQQRQLDRSHRPPLR